MIKKIEIMTFEKMISQSETLSSAIKSVLHESHFIGRQTEETLSVPYDKRIVVPGSKVTRICFNMAL